MYICIQEDTFLEEAARFYTAELICIYVCMYVNVYIYIYMYVCTLYTYVYIYMCICVNFMYIYIQEDTFSEEAARFYMAELILAVQSVHALPCIPPNPNLLPSQPL
jgi:hypothetical protein